MFGDTFAEQSLDAFTEILRRCRRSGESKICRVTRLEQTEQAFHADLIGQTECVRLKRIWRERAAHVDDGFAFVFDELSGEDFVDQLLHPGIAEMQPMAGAIAEETTMTIPRADDASGFILAFDHDVVLAEVVGA